MKSIKQLNSAVVLIVALLTLPCGTWAEEKAAPVAAPTAAPAIQVQPATENTRPVVMLPTKAELGRIRLGYIDVARIFEESKPGKASKALFRDKADKYEAKAKGKQKQLDKLKATLEAQLPTLPADQRAAKIKDFDKKVDDFRHFAQGVEKEIKALQEELNKNMSTALEKAARTYGEANGFTIIVTKKETLYLSPGVDAQDITDAVLKQVNEQQ